MIRPALLLLALLGCSSATPAPIDPCAQYVDSVYGCDDLAPPVIEPLLPWPDSLP